MDVVMTMKVWKIQNVLNKNLAIGDRNIYFYHRLPDLEDPECGQSDLKLRGQSQR